MSLLPSGAIETGGYDINNSLRFRASANGYLQRTPSVAGNRKTWTWSSWVKLGTYLTTSTNLQLFSTYGGSGSAFSGIRFDYNSGDCRLIAFDWTGAALTWAVQTTQAFRDFSSWYHIVVAVDTTQATASNRVKIYVNGSQITALATASYPSLNYDTYTNTTQVSAVGATKDSSTREYFDGYMAEVNFVDGSAKAASDFGETDAVTGVWKPKKYTGTYGTNGFYLKFSDIATTSGSNAGLGKDFSGNSNYWTTNNISVTSGTTYDAMTDSPTNTSATVANYATLNPIDTNTASSISGANLNWVDAGGIDREIRGTIGVSSGKYYWEVVLTSSNTSHVGVDTLNSTLLVDYLGSTSTSWSIYLATGNKRNAGSNTSYGSSLAANDIMMCALDMDNGKIWWGKNGTWFASGDPAAGTNAAFTNLSGYTIAFAATPRSSCSVNFGQRPFSYTPPTGFNRLNTYNLPTPTILQGNKNFGVLTYTGNGSTSVTRSDTNAVNFTPDFVWIKSRSSTNYNNLYDVNRIVSGDHKRLYSNDTLAEESSTYLGATNLNGFVNGGFTTGAGGDTNTNSATYVAWNWKANGSPVTNTSGSITSTVSANTTAGFSIVTYTGTGSVATVGHGLGVAPRMIIVKSRSAGSTDWVVYHASLGATKNVRLQSTAVAATQTVMWNDTAPTSTVFTIGTNNNVNTNGQTQVAYCWAEIAGFSKFGSYTGNGSTDGPFIYTGFRPSYILLKRTDAANVWLIGDSKRDGYNSANPSANKQLQAQAANTESNFDIDYLSNGFKLRNTDSYLNASGGTYIYAAFAENPFKNALAR